MPIDLRAMRYVIAIAETGSFQRAAGQLRFTVWENPTPGLRNFGGLRTGGFMLLPRSIEATSLADRASTQRVTRRATNGPLAPTAQSSGHPDGHGAIRRRTRSH